MRITIGDAGAEDTVGGPRWLVHGHTNTPEDPEWSWRQWWIGWGHVDLLALPGWRYGGFVFYRRRHWGPLWLSQARLRRGLPPLNCPKVPAKSDQYP